jgi:hypothetical protein
VRYGICVCVCVCIYIYIYIVRRQRVNIRTLLPQCKFGTYANAE